MCVPCRQKASVMYDRVRLANDKLNTICGMPPHDRKKLLTKNYMNQMISGVSHKHLVQPKINSKPSLEDLDKEIDILVSTVENKVPKTLTSISRKIVKANNKENHGLRPGRGKRTFKNQEAQENKDVFAERSLNVLEITQEEQL